MTLQAKTFVISLVVLITVIFSFALFINYRALHDSMLNLLFVSGDIVIAGSDIQTSLTGDEMDREAARRIIEGVPETMRALPEEKLTQDEFHDMVEVKLAFTRISRLLQGLPSDRTAAESKLRQIQHELQKIEGAVREFRKSVMQRIDRDMANIVKIQSAIFATAGIGIIFIALGFYRSFLRPILNLTRQVEAVKDGRIENISIYKGGDELGSLSEFTHQTLYELQKSNRALSERYGMQYAISEILKAAQKTGSVDVFLRDVLETILSIEWLGIQSKGGIFLIDEKKPDRLVLIAEKNFLGPHKEICSEVPMGRCLCGRAAENAVSIYKPSCDEEHEVTYYGLSPHGHYCVPILHKDKVLGVINLYTEDGQALSKTEMEFIDAISLIVAESLLMRKLSESEHLITKAVEEAGDGVIIADRHGGIEYVNPSIKRITGYSENELIGKNLVERIQPRERADELRKCVVAGEVWSGTLKNKRKDGTDYYEHLSAIPVKDESGKIRKFVYISKDITKERSLEDQLRQAQKMEVFGRLAGGIAHDFNNILTAIIGYATFLIEGLREDAALGSYAEQILSSSEKAASVTQGLLAFSRKQIMNPLPVDLNDIIRHLEKFLLRFIGEDIELRTILADGPLTVMADTVQIEQVLMNLATNARDAMPNGGLLTIKTEAVTIDSEYVDRHLFAKAGGYACISVTDTGSGMDEDTRENLFEPFFTTKDVGRGVGLGLAIVYGIIRQHEGDINVYSELGSGSTFRIYLPLTSSRVEERKQKAASPPKGGTETVLLAEDNAAVRGLLRAVLERAGYSVIEASDGEEAVHKFMENRDAVHLLLFDVTMPKKNGKEAYEEIKGIRPLIRAVFMSGYTAEIIDRKGLLETGTDFVPKPVGPAELLRSIREVLDRGA
jgi:PAS domain S-box-containing protein